MVTITDVAAHAGVGAGTVSRVLNDSPKVSADDPGPGARRHRRPSSTDPAPWRGRCRAVGPTPSASSSPSSPTPRRSSGCAASSPSCAAAATTSCCSTSSRRCTATSTSPALTAPRPGRRAPRSCRSHRRRRRSLGCVAAGVPIVLVDASGDGRARRASPTTSRAAASRPATSSPSATSGIAFIGDTPEQPRSASRRAPAREQGYRRRCADAGHPLRSPLRHATAPTSATSAAVSPSSCWPCADRPTAVFAASDVQATGVLEAAASRGRRRARATCRSSASTTSSSPATPASPRCASRCSRAATSAPRCCSTRSQDDRPRGRRRAPPAARARRALDDARPPRHGVRAGRREVCLRSPASHRGERRMADIVLDDVWKVYADGTEAVRALDLDIADGEFMVLVGPSGCGKTTALRMVAGLEAISEGHAPHRRPRRERRAAEGPRHRHGLPELRAVPAHERVRQHGLRPQAAEGPEARDRRSGCARRPASSASTSSSPASPRPSPAASASGSPWAGPSSATRRRS